MLSFAAFWLAYKSKELAVMLPVVLVVFEMWFGKRRWKLLAPFFLTSLSFGLQGMLRNPNRDNDYTFRFTAAALAKTSVFYAGRIFLIPYLGFVTPLFAFLARNRRTWFGLAAMGLFLFPMLFLPAGSSAPTATCRSWASRSPLRAWRRPRRPPRLRSSWSFGCPMDIHELRLRRRETLANDDEVRAWMKYGSPIRRRGKQDVWSVRVTPARLGGFHSVGSGGRAQILLRAQRYHGEVYWRSGHRRH